jgi:hypothetical protein
MAEIENRCPAFSWSEIPAVDEYELVVYGLPAAVDLGQVDPDSFERVITKTVAGNATSWTPNLDLCLEPGQSYLWFVRGITHAKVSEPIHTGPWSRGLLFRVTLAPSSQEVSAALDVLRRHRAAATNGASTTELPSSAPPATDSLQPPPPETRADPPPDAPLTSASSAIYARIENPSGETYGVIGMSDSPDGAGIAAANTAGGADLVLDGSFDGTASTFVSERGIDRPSGSPQTFNIHNSGGGGMTLQIDGVEAITTATDEDTLGDLSCGAGDMPRWDGFNWTCAQGSLITSLSAGSGLTGGGSQGTVSLGIQNGGVTATHLAANSVGASELAVNSVTSSHIVNGTITYADTNTSSVQRRVTGACTTGSSIASIASDGTVSCYADKYLSVIVGDYLSADVFNGGNVYDHWYYTPPGTHFCYLSFVQLRDVDGGSEDAYCNVYPDSANGRWTLRAHSEPGDDADAKCRARCYTFRY